MMGDAFDRWFGETLSELLRIRRPFALPRTITGWPETPRPGWEAVWETATRALVAEASPEFRQDSQVRGDALGRALDEASARIDATTFHSVVAAKLRVEHQDRFDCAPDEDFWYLKINHGYWEQLFRIFGTPDPVKMRVRSAEYWRWAYIDTGFAFALEALIARYARLDAGTLSFPGMHFGFNLMNGSDSHETLVENFLSSDQATQVILQGATIGLTATFESLYGPCRLALADGSFPKRAAMEGSLRETLYGFAAHSDRIFFVVPPHLKGITLEGVDIPQETLLVPGERVHECWAAALWAVGRRVFEQLETNARVMIITQSAVFSALLGLFLRAAKDALQTRGRQLFFFDLGQALDSATPASGGLWIKKYEVKDLSLFRIPEAKGLAPNA